MCCAVRLCVGERSDGLLVAWRFYDCVLVVPPPCGFSLSLFCNYLVVPEVTGSI